MDRDCDCIHKRLQQVRQINAKPCIVTYYNLYTKPVIGACDLCQPDIFWKLDVTINVFH